MSLPHVTIPGASFTRASLRHVAVVATAAAALLVAALLLTMIAQAGRILPGTEVLGVDVGGQDPWSARRALAPALERAERRPVAVSAPGVRLVVRPSDVGVRYDLEATVDAALAHGRRGPLGPLARLTAPLVGARIDPRAHVDETMLAAWVDDVIARVDRPAHPGDLRIDAPGRTVRIEGPQGAVTVDRAASVERLRTALTDPTVGRVTIAATATPPPTDRRRIEAIAESVTRAIRVGLTFEHEGRRLRLTAEDIAALVTVVPRPNGDAVIPVLHVPHERVDRFLGDEARRAFDRSPQPARLVIGDVDVMLDTRGSVAFQPVPIDATVAPSISRTVFVPRRLARQIEAMLSGGVDRATADLLVIEPDLTTEDAEERRPTHVIGTFTTRFVAGGNRTVNIARLAALLDGSLIAPGAEFSVNRASGPRSCAAGFLEAGTIVRGELVDTCGGGVSQVGTTLLNAAFFAGLPLTEWHPHSFFISRYPAGREATLSYPDLDVRFLNDTDGWIVVRATTTPTSVTVTLLGRPRWWEVRAAHGPWSPLTPFTELVRVAPDLPQGSRRVVQAGGDGFSLTVTRTRIGSDASVAPEVERWRTVYRPQQRIIEVSPADAPDGAAPPAADAGASAG